MDKQPLRLKSHRGKWALATLAILGLIALAVFLMTKRNDPSPRGHSAIPVESGELGLVPPSLPQERSAAALEALVSFANAPDHAFRVPLLHERDVSANTLREFYTRDPELLPETIVNPSVSAIELDGREILLVSFIDHKQRPWSAPFEWSRGSYKLHWKAMTGYCEIPWSTFIEQRPEGRFTMRGKLYLPSTDSEEPGATGFITALVAHPDLSQPIPVRIQQGSEASNWMGSFHRAKDIPGIFEFTWESPVPADSTRPTLTHCLKRDWIE